MGDDPQFFPNDMMLGFGPHRRPEKPYYTLREHRYDDGIVRMKVPEDFHTDLTTHPKHLHWYLLALWPLTYFFGWLPHVMIAVAILTIWVRDPLGRHQRAALFHDRNYQKQKYDRYTADAVYAIMLKEDGVGWLRRHLHYFALRLFGGIAWRHNARKFNTEQQDV